MATDTALDVVMPQMGVSVSEGTITKWLKQEGESVEADEPLLEISTDKIDTEVPSPGSGVLTQILVQEGETVDVGTKLAQIGGAEARSRRLQRPSPSPNRSPRLPLRRRSRCSSARSARACSSRSSSRPRTGSRSSLPSSRASRQSTASIPARCTAPAAAAA